MQIVHKAEIVPHLCAEARLGRDNSYTEESSCPQMGHPCAPETRPSPSPSPAARRGIPGNPRIASVASPGTRESPGAHTFCRPRLRRRGPRRAWQSPLLAGSGASKLRPRRGISALAEAGDALPLVEWPAVAPPPPGPDARTLSGGGRQKNCPSEERLRGVGSTVGVPASGPPRGCRVGVQPETTGGRGWVG